MSASPPMIYLDNAATSFPKPAAVATAAADFLTHRAVNPGRSGFDLSREVGLMVDGVRLKLDRLFNNPATDPDRSIFTANATDALNLAIQGICRPGDHVVATVLEHNSVLRPLYMLRQAGIITFDLVGCGTDGRLDPAAFNTLIKSDTRLVVMTHASNVCGAVQPAGEIGALCRERGILFLLDAAQTAGLIPVDMAALSADLVAFTGHKSLLGPTGTGGLVVGPDVDIRSTRWGGTGVRSSLVGHPDEFPWRLEAGTLNTVGIAGLAAALDWIENRGRDAILEHELRLAGKFVAGLSPLENIKVQGAAASPGGKLAPGQLPVISVTVAGRTPEEIGLFLDADWNIAARTGLHCAPLAHEALGTADGGSVRFSFGPFNTDRDVVAALEAMEHLSR